MVSLTEAAPLRAIIDLSGRIREARKRQRGKNPSLPFYKSTKTPRAHYLGLLRCLGLAKRASAPAGSLCVRIIKFKSSAIKSGNEINYSPFKISGTNGINENL